MKKKIIFILITLLMLFSLIGLYIIVFPNKEDSNIKEDKKVVKEEKVEIDYNEKLKKLIDQNNKIVGYLVIPDVLETSVIKGNDNDYYLSHDMDGRQDIRGSIFLDYRVNIGDKKTLIYGHSGNEEGLVFNALNGYEDESFYQEHPTIYLYTLDNKYQYDIFSSYVETSDFDYVNIKSFNGTYLNHLLKLKNKSDYNININLDENSKIIILQTCSMNNDIDSYRKYRLVIGKEL